MQLISCSDSIRVYKALCGPGSFEKHRTTVRKVQIDNEQMKLDGGNMTEIFAWFALAFTPANTTLYSIFGIVHINGCGCSHVIFTRSCKPNDQIALYNHHGLLNVQRESHDWKSQT